MCKLSQIVFLMLMPLTIWAQSPHGDDFNINCDVCHTAESWGYIEDSHFNHDSTAFELIGQHKTIACRLCHPSLDFEKAKTSCISCHSDIHNNTVGQDCDQCHTTTTWIVTNIREIHQFGRMPLLGAHAIADCQQCHPSASLLRFEPIGTDCYDCHKEDYLATNTPSHVAADFSTDCMECHNMIGSEWGSDGFEHGFFPLTQGHRLDDCAECHKEDQYKNTSPDCNDCHAADYDAAKNPSHLENGFERECDECHTTRKDWKPATYQRHDGAFFPIYSGTHGGAWDNCTECHTDQGSFNTFSCTACHKHDKSSTDRKHDDVRDYIYESNACYACHPTGRKEGSFNHNTTDFPLTGAHRDETCNSCHSSGYAGTPLECNACHSEDYIASKEPPHQRLDFPVNCEECHSTDPDWTPASFAIHDTYYPLNGAHANIAADCNQCHEDGYTNTPNNCVGCHAEEYNSTRNPSHTTAMFPKECETCHSESSWTPSTFNHDEHYVLNGQHASIADNCNLCHAEGYTNTPNECKACHQADYDGTTDPSHTDAGFSLDCALCHTSQGWESAKFVNHDGAHFPIYSGSHNGEWDNCAECHTTANNYNLFDCTACHEHNKTETDSDHQGISGYAYNSSSCYACHPTGRSEGAFDHNTTNFPLTGAHVNEQCISCHASGYAGTSMICNSCHNADYIASIDPPHQSLGFPTDCDDCHTTKSGWAPATFAIHDTYHPLNGAHASIATDCKLCHKTGFLNTPNTCDACHSEDFNATTNPSHVEADFSRECEACHSESAWIPSSFNHDDHYPLRGAHALVASDCKLCHAGGYTNTPNECFGCHATDYNNTTNPAHATAQFPKDCEPCHTLSAWEPSTFNHDAQYFPIKSGKHREEWQNCSDCHNNASNFAIFVCTDCHEHNQSRMDPKHKEVNGYAFNSVSCLGCHPQGESN